MTFEIRLFPCLSDNFGVLLHDTASGATASIDAPEAAPIAQALAETGWRLTDILVTHHHRDHTDGIEALKAAHGCRVTAPAREADKVPAVDRRVAEGDTLTVGTLSAKVIETPGHTLGQVAYWFDGIKAVFVGDTLFSIGCGRVIEGDPAMMWQSLLKLRALPDETQIYCGHEYTEANIRFAETIEKDNTALMARAKQVRALRAAGQFTVPSAMGEEKAANPFLRADIAAVAQAVGLAGASAADVFTEVRKRKNEFRG